MSNYPPQDPAGYPDQQQPPYPTAPHAAVKQQEAGYPQQTPYPQQPAAYPQQQGYLPEQAGFSAAAPPPYYPQQQQQPSYPVAQQQTATSNVVVVQQPQTAVVTQRYNPHSEIGQSAMIFAIIVTIFAIFSQCYWALLCSIPAIVFANNATTAGNRGDVDSAQSNQKLSIGCSVGAITSGVLGVMIFIGGILAWYFTVVFAFRF